MFFAESIEDFGDHLIPGLLDDLLSMSHNHGYDEPALLEPG